MHALLAAQSDVLVVSPEHSAVTKARGVADRPTCLAADPLEAGRVWCGTHRSGVFRSDDGGASWRHAGLRGREITALACSPTDRGVVWAGTEPSEVWHSDDGGSTWEQAKGLAALPSSSEWSFPPRPDTHHVRWLACHPRERGQLWVAIEAGALVFTPDGGRTWRDRVPGGPYDTHELAIHPAAPDTLRVSAGDGYFESDDGGSIWRSPDAGLEFGYLRSIAIDPGSPDIVAVSGASHPHRAYVAGVSDGRVYRRVGRGPWERVKEGWPDPPHTIAPLLAAGMRDGELWAADERGVHRSGDSGTSWRQVAGYPKPPHHLRGLVLVA